MTSHQQPVPFTSQWSVVQGLPMHTRVPACIQSNGCPPVVLIHGMIIASRYLLPTAALLASEYAVYVPDLPGFGQSLGPSEPLDIAGMADALVEWMAGYNLEQVVLLGNSLGCQIIVDFAVRYPKRLRATVLQGPTVDPQARTLLHQIIRLLRHAPLERPSQTLLMASDYMTAGWQRIIGMVRTLLSDPVEKKLPHVRVPTLVVRESRDPVVPQRWAEEVVRLLPLEK